MQLIDKQILVVRVGLSKSIRNLKKHRTNWRIKNYEVLSKKLEEFINAREINKFQEVLNGKVGR